MSVYKIAIAVFVAGMLTVPGAAQVTTATFYGVVTDPSGGVIPGADVSLTNERTAAVAVTATDSRGEFAFVFLPVGVYTLRIEIPGFKVLQSTGIQMSAAQVMRTNFVMELGEVGETVTVTESTSLVNTVSLEQRVGATTLEVQELPLARRSIDALLGVNVGTVVNPGRSIYFDGLGAGSVSLTVDGTEGSVGSGAEGSPGAATPRLGAGSGGLGLISLEAIEEVEMVKGILPAEYANALSGNVNVITKSGTNDFHGTLFHSWQGRVLNARNPLQATKSPFVFNQFGASAGGPIIREKLFIFGVYEGYRESAFAIVNGNVPTERLRNEMLARVPEYRLFLDTQPLPNQPHDPDGVTGQYIASASRTARENSIVIKPDWWISNTDKISAMWNHSRPKRFIPSVTEVNPRTFAYEGDTVNLNYVRYGTVWSAETRWGYRWGNERRLDAYYNLKDPNQSEESFEGGRRVPGLRGPGFGDPGGELQDGQHKVWTLEQKVARQAGQHSLKFGGNFFKRKFGNANTQSPTFIYNSEADLLNNIANRLTFTFGAPLWIGRSHELGFFVQDHWRVTPRLVLNLGLRYDYYSNFVAEGPDGGPPHVFNPDGILDTTTFTLGEFRPFDDPFEPDAMNFGVRLGLAFDPRGTGQTVIRAGYSTQFVPISGQQFYFLVSMAPDWPFRSIFGRLEGEALGLKYPAYNEDVLELAQSGPATFSRQVLNPNISAPYAQNFQLNVQQMLTPTLMLETGFVGNRGVKLLMLRDYNQPDRITGEKPNPDLAIGRYIDNSNSSLYLGWQTTLRKRMSKGLVGNAHYTWGKALCYGQATLENDPGKVQGFDEVGNNRGVCAEAVHVFNADFIYETPNFGDFSNPLLRHLFGTWQLTGIFGARSGQPMDVTQPAGSYQRPDATGIDPYMEDAPRTLFAQYLNPAAFARVPVSPVSGEPIRPGNLGKNAIWGIARWNLDLGVGKNIYSGDLFRFQVRFDMFNALNHPTYGGINTNIANNNFGKITGASGGRVGQLSARLSW